MYRKYFVSVPARPCRHGSVHLRRRAYWSAALDSTVSRQVGPGGASVASQPMGDNNGFLAC